MQKGLYRAANRSARVFFKDLRGARPEYNVSDGFSKVNFRAEVRFQNLIPSRFETPISEMQPPW